MENVPRPGVPNRAIRDGSRRKRRSGASGVSGGLFYALLVSGVVFENSAACVYVETLASASACSAGWERRRGNKTRHLRCWLNNSSGRGHFEHKLEVKACRLCWFTNSGRQTIFTESLILAQD